MKGYVYTAQNQAWSVWNGASQATASQRTRWYYGPDGGRYKRIDDGSNNTARTVLTLGGVERITTGTVVTWRRSLAGGLVQTFAGATPATARSATAAAGGGRIPGFIVPPRPGLAGRVTA